MAPVLTLKCGNCDNITNFTQTQGTKYCPHCQMTICIVNGIQVILKNGTKIERVHGDR